jgi:hypothetical protein
MSQVPSIEEVEVVVVKTEPVDEQESPVSEFPAPASSREGGSRSVVANEQVDKHSDVGSDRAALQQSSADSDAMDVSENAAAVSANGGDLGIGWGGATTEDNKDSTDDVQDAMLVDDANDADGDDHKTKANQRSSAHMVVTQSPAGKTSADGRGTSATLNADTSDDEEDRADHESMDTEDKDNSINSARSNGNSYSKMAKPVPPPVNRTASDKSKGSVIFESFTPNDIVLGKGNGINCLPGNIKFRQLIWKYKSTYKMAPRSQKHTIAEKVLHEISQKWNPPGRFLSPHAVSGFELVGDRRALEKTCQALREKVKPLKDGGYDVTPQKAGGSMVGAGLPNSAGVRTPGSKKLTKSRLHAKMVAIPNAAKPLQEEGDLSNQPAAVTVTVTAGTTVAGEPQNATDAATGTPVDATTTLPIPPTPNPAALAAMASHPALLRLPYYTPQLLTPPMSITGPSLIRINPTDVASVAAAAVASVFQQHQQLQQHQAIASTIPPSLYPILPVMPHTATAVPPAEGDAVLNEDNNNNDNNDGGNVHDDNDGGGDGDNNVNEEMAEIANAAAAAAAPLDQMSKNQAELPLEQSTKNASLSQQQQSVQPPLQLPKIQNREETHTPDNDVIVTDLREYDVLYGGRGRKYFKRPANFQFQNWMKKRKEQYWQSTNSKREVAWQIIQEWQNQFDPPGRFLQPMPPSLGGKEGSGQQEGYDYTEKWRVVPDDRVLEKTCQALRDLKRERMNPYPTQVPSGSDADKKGGGKGSQKDRDGKQGKSGGTGDKDVGEDRNVKKPRVSEAQDPTVSDSSSKVQGAQCNLPVLRALGSLDKLSSIVGDSDDADAQPASSSLPLVVMPIQAKNADVPVMVGNKLDNAGRDKDDDDQAAISSRVDGTDKVGEEERANCDEPGAAATTPLEGATVVVTATDLGTKAVAVDDNSKESGVTDVGKTKSGQETNHQTESSPLDMHQDESKSVTCGQLAESTPQTLGNGVSPTVDTGGADGVGKSKVVQVSGEGSDEFAPAIDAASIEEPDNCGPPSAPKKSGESETAAILTLMCMSR